jgi:bacteriocin biosynthesis cyclodehydratase domain-containing protein
VLLLLLLVLPYGVPLRASFPELPLLTPWHRVAAEPGRLVLEYGGEAVCLEGRATRALLPALLPLLDGTRTVEQVVAVLGDAARPAVEAALVLLAEHRLLTEGPPLATDVPAPFAAAAVAHAAGSARSPAGVRARLAEAAVAVVGSGGTAAEAARLLRLSGVGRVERAPWSGSDAELAVVAPGPGERPLLPGWNEHALASGTAWLQVLAFDGAFAAIGPLYLPGETCCYECYLRRRASNVDYPDEFWALERTPDRASDAPATVAAVAGLAVGFALRWLLAEDPFVAGVMVALELGDETRLSRHHVYRVPRCTACSTVAGQAPPLPWAEAS